jgi:c(7)-type cytochrome triheme protein
MRSRPGPAVLAMVLALALASPGHAEYGDIRFTRPKDPTPEYPPALFPHWIHRMQFRCYVCHTSIFEMKAGANAITMQAIQDGQFCGVCHNGKVAFSVVFESCPRCHTPQ